MLLSLSLSLSRFKATTACLPASLFLHTENTVQLDSASPLWIIANVALMKISLCVYCVSSLSLSLSPSSMAALSVERQASRQRREKCVLLEHESAADLTLIQSIHPGSRTSIPNPLWHRSPSLSLSLSFSHCTTPARSKSYPVQLDLLILTQPNIRSSSKLISTDTKTTSPGEKLQVDSSFSSPLSLLFHTFA